MNQRTLKVLLLAALFAVGYALPAQALDFWNLFSVSVSPQSNGTTVASGIINGAKIEGVWVDSNHNGKLDVGEVVLALNVYDRNGNLALSNPINSAQSYDRFKLQDWAIVNATRLLRILFPSGLSEITGASEDNIMASVTAASNLFSRIEAKPQSMGKPQALDQVPADTNGQVEYQYLKLNGNRGNTLGMNIDYAKDNASGLKFTLSMPYRYSAIKDDINSTSHFFGLDLALHYPVKKWDGGEWKVGGALFGSVYSLKTDTIGNSGDLKYGAGLSTAASYRLGITTLSGGLDYRIAKAHVPSSMNSDDEFLQSSIDYINGLEPVQTVSYGVNLGIPLAGEAAAVNMEIVRSNYISSDIPDGQKSKTSLSASGSYYLTDTFELNLGLKYDFELENTRTIGAMLVMTQKF